MRVLSFLALTLSTASPAFACDFDSYPGYSHYSGRGYDDPASVDAAREQAMAEARSTFIRQYGLGETPVAAEAGSSDASAGTAPVSPPSDDLTR